ncbi:hypothetical protein NQ318_013183 [Aromia moschata]|uniref:AP180 N-terminal homology (ANTH) domain-containing protein n=1 Tax=Aromia moschata TaxID=1265417 RepID=A0AAV8X479_9CUCU|nr:hypothetical protein NQ318_013183 [Aromia moschata]
MNKKQCREALDLYKKFLIRMDRVAEFLKVAENIGIDKGDIPDLTRAPNSLLDALEQHLASLEGNTPTAVTNQKILKTACRLCLAQVTLSVSGRRHFQTGRSGRRRGGPESICSANDNTVTAPSTQMQSTNALDDLLSLAPATSAATTNGDFFSITTSSADSTNTSSNIWANNGFSATTNAFQQPAAQPFTAANDLSGLSNTNEPSVF